ncbi:transglycosylase SLT domain-containing protein [Bradyrhizobium erythrophlei]|uniref:Transglycosylase SLT domain-containing protein n=1 Tax=Bradyrhizobium erythrophlei TaxID=1437360 RepID=A0A1M5JJW6_9BRAD|nr:transglycosylase SLT domain-containing protein [Bradyrhizobium erythrophlei]SHG40874.1 Transglycosylase SLT domain-containing protein [Bradyrhizobium erythrophlei]
MVPALTVVLAGCVVAWVAGFGSSGIEDTAAAPIIDRPPPSLTADAEIADSPQTTVLANAAVDSADTAAPAAVVTATDTRAVSDEPEPIAEAAATSLAAIHQIAVPRPSVATPNARVADAFSAIPLNLTTVPTTVRASLLAPAIEAKFDTRSSANAIVAAEFSDAAPDAVMPSDVTSSLRQGLMLRARASLEAAPPENEATSQQDRPLAASPNPDEGELPYLKYYVYSECPPPEKPAKIALSALSDVPLGTPVQEIERAAEAFGVDVNFMKAVAKIESDFNPRQRTGSYIGLFQLSKFEFSKYGSGDILNPRDNAMGAAYKFLSEAALFEIMTQKKPTFSDLYLIHQQGWEGAAQHISRPQRIAWKSMCATQEGSAKGERWCKRAIWGNTLPAVKREWKSVDSLTSGAFVAMWRDRVDTLYARYPVLTAAAERLR